MQFKPSQSQNGFTPPGEPAESREAASHAEKKKAGLLSNYASPSTSQESQQPAGQNQPPAASWAIREDAPPAASWAIQDNAPPAASWAIQDKTPPASSWAYVDEQEHSITPELPAERFTDPFMKRDEAQDFLAGRISPHQSAIEHSPFAPNRPGAPGPMQQPSPAQQRPPTRPMTPPPTGYAQSGWPAQQRPPFQQQQPPFQQPAPFSSVQTPRPMMGPPGSNMAPQQSVYLRGPAPQQQRAPMSALNRPGYVNGPPPSMYATNKKARKKKRLPAWAGVLIATLVVMIAGGAYYYAQPYLSIIGRSTSQTATHFDTGTDKKGSMATPVTDTGPILSKPFNLLLLGSDTDAKFGDTYLAQTDIIIRIDPANKYVGMLSIPRDMQVTIPGYGADKLDLAFADGYRTKRTPDNPVADGAGLAIATIEKNYGIPINGYAWVGLDGFIKVINTVDGVDVDVLHPMVDDTYPDDVDTTTGKTHANYKDAVGYKRLYIAPGPQHLSGFQALEYVRTRHSDLTGDFGRSIRQQQVLNQLKAKLEKPEIVAQLPELAKDLDGYVKTSMSLSDLASLANFARTIDTNKIDRLVLSPPYSAPITNSSNFAPICDKIVPAIQKMFALGDNEVNCIPQTVSGTAGKAIPQIPSGMQNTTTSTNSTIGTPTQRLNPSTQMNMLSLNQSYVDPSYGVQCLLNLMFMVTFESVGAMTTT